MLFIVLALAASLYYTDLESSSTFNGVALPILDFVLLCSLAIWLVNRGMGQRFDRGGADDGAIGGFFDGGGDGGGGGCD